METLSCDISASQSEFSCVSDLDLIDGHRGQLQLVSGEGRIMWSAFALLVRKSVFGATKKMEENDNDIEGNI